MKDSRCSYLLLLCPLLGCVELAEASEPWMAPPEVLGKADAIATLPGKDIPSSFVDGRLATLGSSYFLRSAR